MRRRGWIQEARRSFCLTVLFVMWRPFPLFMCIEQGLAGPPFI